MGDWTTVWARPGGALAVAFVVLAGTLGVRAAGSQQAPAPSATVPGPLYSMPQALRGEVLVKQHCAACHREDLQSGEGDIAMSGPNFLEHWGLMPLGDMAQLIRSTMPTTNINSLTLQEATDIVAYVLWMNYYPAGPKELPADVAALRRIVLQTPEAHLETIKNKK